METANTVDGRRKARKFCALGTTPCPARNAHMHCTATVGHGSMNERGTYIM
jgi:hypothetical protein